MSDVLLVGDADPRLVPVWEPSTPYVEGDQVMFDNQLQVCVAPGTSTGTFDQTMFDPAGSGSGGGGGGGSATFAGLTDVNWNAPAKGQIPMVVSGELTNEDPPWNQASGPGNTVLGVSGTSPVIPDPLDPVNGFGIYAMLLTPASGSTVTITMPTPTIGSRFTLVLRQNGTGGITPAFAATPPVLFEGPQLNPNLGANGENALDCICLPDHNGVPTWFPYPGTSAALNLNDLPNPGSARFNLHDPMLASAKAAATVGQGNIALTGLQTFDGKAMAAGDVGFLFNQTDPTQNGPWVIETGVWQRPTFYPSTLSYPFSPVIAVAGGNTLAGTMWVGSATSLGAITIDSTGTTWTQVGAASTPTLNYENVFGDGSDGVCTFDGTTAVPGCTLASGTYTLNRDVYATNATCTAPIVFNGFRLFCTGTFQNNTGNTVGVAGNNAAGATAGAATNAGTLGGGLAGGNGATGNGAAGNKGATGSGAGGGAGGTGSAGSAPGSLLSSAQIAKAVLFNPFSALSGALNYGGASTSTGTLCGGSSGGGGGGDGTNSGGGGGGGGPAVAIFCKTFSNQGTILASGGNGAAGVAGNAGGGGGGCGGLVLVYTLTISHSGTITVAGGTAGAAAGTGAAGSAGGAGQSIVAVLN